MNKLGQYIKDNNDKKKFQFIYLVGLVFPLLTFILMFFAQSNIVIKAFINGSYTIHIVESHFLFNYLFSNNVTVLCGISLILCFVGGITLLLLESFVSKFTFNRWFKLAKFLSMLMFYIVLIISICCFDYIFIDDKLSKLNVGEGSNLYYLSTNGTSYALGLICIFGLVYEIVVYVIKFDTFNNKYLNFKPIYYDDDEFKKNKKDDENIEFIKIEKKDDEQENSESSEDSISDDNIMTIDIDNDEIKTGNKEQIEQKDNSKEG